MSDVMSGIRGAAAGTVQAVNTQVKVNEPLRQDTEKTIERIMLNIKKKALKGYGEQNEFTIYADLVTVIVRGERSWMKTSKVGYLKTIFEIELKDSKTPGDIFLKEAIKKHPVLIDSLAKNFYILIAIEHNGFQEEGKRILEKSSSVIHEGFASQKPGEYKELVRLSNQGIKKHQKPVKYVAPNALKNKLIKGVDKTLALGLKDYLKNFMSKQLLKDAEFMDTIKTVFAIQNGYGNASRTEKTEVFKYSIPGLQQIIKEHLEKSKPCASRNFLLAVFDKLPDYAERFTRGVYREFAMNSLMGDSLGKTYNVTEMILDLHNKMATEHPEIYKEICGTVYAKAKGALKDAKSEKFSSGKGPEEAMEQGNTRVQKPGDPSFNAQMKDIKAEGIRAKKAAEAKDGKEAKREGLPKNIKTDARIKAAEKK